MYILGVQIPVEGGKYFEYLIHCVNGAHHHVTFGLLCVHMVKCYLGIQ